MTLETFATGTSSVHQADPRLKVLSASAFALVVALSYRFETLVVAMAYALLLVGMARLNLVALSKRLAALTGFLILLWLVLPATFPGEVLLKVGPVAVYKPGVVLAAQISIKTVAILLAFTALIATMSVATLGAALDNLRLPVKLVALLLMTYRYLFVFQREFTRLSNAAKIRGFRPGTNLHTYKTLAYFIGMLFVQAATRAQRVHNAMRCRGFKGRFYSLNDFAPFRQSMVPAGALTLMVISLVWLEWI